MPADAAGGTAAAATTIHPARPYPIVDSQVHVWKDDTPDRPWVADGHLFAHREQAFGIDELRAEMAAAGVDAAVLVPPSWEGDRNDLALEAVRRFPSRFAAMGRVPFGAADWADQVRSWRDLGLSGHRIVVARPADVARYQSGGMEPYWSLAETSGIPVMAYMPDRVSWYGDVARAHPGLRLVVDHLGIPTDAGLAEAGAIVSDLVALAGHQNLAVKLSGLPAVASDEYPYRSVHPLVYRIVEAFGAERVFWASDLTRLPCTYTQAVDMFTDDLDGLSQSEREWIMGRGIRTWLEWENSAAL